MDAYISIEVGWSNIKSRIVKSVKEWTFEAAGLNRCVMTIIISDKKKAHQAVVGIGFKINKTAFIFSTITLYMLSFFMVELVGVNSN